MIKVKKIFFDNSLEIDTTCYEHYKYINTTRENLVYLFGEPSASIFCPDDEELIEYAKSAGIMSYDYWLLEADDSDATILLIDGEDFRKDVERAFCVSSNDKSILDFISSMICKDKWPVADEVRKKIFISE